MYMIVDKLVSRYGEKDDGIDIQTTGIPNQKEIETIKNFFNTTGRDIEYLSYPDFWVDCTSANRTGMFCKRQYEDELSIADPNLELFVKPILRISIPSVLTPSLSSLRVGDIFSFGDKPFVIVTNTLAFCLSDIGKSCYNKQTVGENIPQFKETDIKKFIGKWFFKALDDADKCTLDRMEIIRELISKQEAQKKLDKEIEELKEKLGLGAVYNPCCYCGKHYL